MSEVRNEKDLAAAMKRGDDSIEIEIELGNRIWKIRNVKNWSVVIVGVTAALAAGAVGVATALSGGAAAPAAAASGFVAIPAVGITAGAIGVPATISAISLASALGGAKKLKKLKEYDVEKTDTKVILRKKRKDEYL